MVMRAFLLACALFSAKSIIAEQYEGNSNPWVTQASGHRRDGHGLNWDVSIFKGNGVSDVFPKQIESDPSSDAFYVTGSWKGEVTLGEHTMRSVNCVDSQECSFFVMKMKTTGLDTEVLWARTLVQPERNISVLSQNSMDVGPDGGVVIDGQYCFDNIVVGDGNEKQVLTLDKQKDNCLGFVAKFDSAGKLLWANKFGLGNKKMSEGQLRVHSATGDIFISGLFMGDDVRYGGTIASSRRRDVDGQPPAGLFYDAGETWSHQYSIWVAKMAGGDGEMQWLQTLNTSNTQVTMPNMVLDDSTDTLYLSLSTHDPPFYLHTSPNGAPALADGYVVKMDTDGNLFPAPFTVEAVQETSGQEEADRNDPMGQFSYLKYMTSVAAADGSLFVSGVFYGTVKVQGRAIRSQSTRHEASFVARVSPDGLQLEWLELLQATDNLSVQHIELADSSLYIVGWLVGDVNFGNGVVLSTLEGGLKRSESFVLEMSQTSGTVRWAEKGSAEEFFDASLVPNVGGDGQAALVILGGFYWTAKLDTNDEDTIFTPWNKGEQSDLSGMVIMAAALDANNISPVVTSDHSPIWFGPAPGATGNTGRESRYIHPSAVKQADEDVEGVAAPYDSGAAGTVDFSPAAREIADRHGTASSVGGEDNSGALSVLSISMITLAVLVGLLALTGVLCVVTVCLRKRSLSSMYTHWRHTTESLPGHSRNPSAGSGFFVTGHSRNPSIASASTNHSRTPSDVVANLALVRMTHLPPSSFETPAGATDPAHLTSALEQLQHKPSNKGEDVAPEGVTVDIAPPN